MTIKIKRVYEGVAADDGYRVLVDRLWPRGVKKEHAHVDAWVRDVAPSNALRKWYAHDVAKWDEFRRRYCAELAANEIPLRSLADKAAAGDVTLVYAARDTVHNNAAVLQEFLERTFLYTPAGTDKR